MIDYVKLFEPYTGDGHTFEAMDRYLHSEAAKFGISDDIVEIALNEVFAGISRGDAYSTEVCRCGCGIDKAGTDLTHYIKQRMVDISASQVRAVRKIMSGGVDSIIEKRIKEIVKSHKAYAKSVRPPLKERSPVLRGVRKAWRSISSQSER